MLSGDLGALEREAAVSDEDADDSGTDEDEHPLRVKPFRFVAPPPAAAGAEGAAAALRARGAAAPCASTPRSAYNYTNRPRFALRACVLGSVSQRVCACA